MPIITTLVTRRGAAVSNWLNETAARRGGFELVERVCGDPDLTDDFCCGQVAVKTLFTGGAKGAIQRATDLRRYAQGAALAFGNIHHLNTTAAIHADQPLAGAVDRVLATDHFGHAHFAHRRQACTQGF